MLEQAHGKNRYDRSTLCRRGAGLVLLVVMLASACAGRQPQRPVAGLPSLDALLAFSSPAECRPGPHLERLYDSMVWVDKAHKPQPRKPVLPPGYDGIIGPPMLAVRGKDHSIIEVPARGRWLGVPVRAIAGIYGHQNDIGGIIVIFDAPAADIVGVLRRHGFTVDGRLKTSVPSPHAEKIGRAALTGDATSSRLTCDWSL